MAKKNYFLGKNNESVDKVVGWKVPVFHQASECYVSFSAFDPARGCMRMKKIMLGHVKGKRNQRAKGEHLVKQLTEKLMEGWNPWIEAESPKEYTAFEDACAKYSEYLIKLESEGGIREETVVGYLSKLKILKEWIREKRMGVTYSYQFNGKVIGEFLDYVFIERNNTLLTRNHYLAWLKVFSKYLLERQYIPSDPTKAFSNKKIKKGRKDRDVIPDNLLKKLHVHLMVENPHFLLACQILHYMFVRPREMSFLKVADFSVKKKTLKLHGDHTKNHNDAVVTVPDHIIKLMVEIGVFNSPGSYYLFSDDFMPGPGRRREKAFRDYWDRRVRKELGFSERYKFYSLKDTGITNMLKSNMDVLSVRDQARHSSILITDIYTPKDIKEANKLIVRYEGEL